MGSGCLIGTDAPDSIRPPDIDVMQPSCTADCVDMCLFAGLMLHVGTLTGSWEHIVREGVRQTDRQTSVPDTLVTNIMECRSHALKQH